MVISPTNVSVPLIAPSINVQSEQAARDNKAREPVTPTMALSQINAERKVNSDEKRRRQSRWDPSQHPDYEIEQDVEASDHQEPEDPLARLFGLLALTSYSEEQGKGYTIRFRLPKRILEAAVKQGLMEKRRKVIKFHYGHSVAPHTPSEVIAVL